MAFVSGRRLSSSFTTPSEATPLLHVTGEGPPAQRCLCLLVWARWAGLGGGEVGQLCSHGNSSCSLPAFPSPRHKPRDEILCPVCGDGGQEGEIGGQSVCEVCVCVCVQAHTSTCSELVCMPGQGNPQIQEGHFLLPCPLKG